MNYPPSLKKESVLATLLLYCDENVWHESEEQRTRRYNAFADFFVEMRDDIDTTVVVALMLEEPAAAAVVSGYGEDAVVSGGVSDGLTQLMAYCLVEVNTREDAIAWAQKAPDDLVVELRLPSDLVELRPAAVHETAIAAV